MYPQAEKNSVSFMMNDARSHEKLHFLKIDIYASEIVAIRCRAYD